MAYQIQNRRYTGSKFKVLDWIQGILENNCPDAHSFCDIFAGTGVVTAHFIDKYDTFIINDFLYSNEIIYKAFFAKEAFDISKLKEFAQRYQQLNPDQIDDNYVSINYGGKYFSENDAKKIGFIREDLEEKKKSLSEREYAILLASLLYSFDHIANTVGHYDAYIKGHDITDDFYFDLIQPIIVDPNDHRNIQIFRRDSNQLAGVLYSDIVYIDPPYSSRQYSRFYHVLENVTEWKNPSLEGVAMKPKEENMSEYCRSHAIDFFTDLVNKFHCKYFAVSYNNTYNSKSNSSKNKMTLEQIEKALRTRGETTIYHIAHNAFNAGKTDLENHEEILFLTKVRQG